MTHTLPRFTRTLTAHSPEGEGGRRPTSHIRYGTQAQVVRQRHVACHTPSKSSFFASGKDSGEGVSQVV